jgi:hypothetical protein
MRRKLTLTSISVLIAMLPLSVFACGGDHGCPAETTTAMLPGSWSFIGIGVALVMLAFLAGLVRRRMS